ncbi:MAG TPA: glycosyltransferase [Pseudoalteromonas sp.]|uniref:Glycosyltransferase subfamily 4-like N-terminal domain-containing protein n=1 Tax=marine sediment metagenome TaxID=412755 RepID=A0A0F9TTP6_9ZZZZ|nr:glycosyltransferase [Pseudoalteromonas sp.]HDZ33950.1 glycosyltransferase [Pseudoalteromonas sp.]
MKVLLVITGLGMGGAEHVVVNMADELTKLGHEVNIVYLTGSAIVLPVNDSIQITSLNMSGPRQFISAYLKLRAVVKDFCPDVIHSHMFHATIITRLLRLSIKIKKIISTSHNTNEGGKARMLAYRMTDRLTNVSTNVSDDAVNELTRKGAVKKGRMIAIPNGINTDYFSFNESKRIEIRSEFSLGSKKLLLAVGRLTEAKDYPNLLLAIQLLKKQRTDFKLLIVGDGHLKSYLVDMVRELELTEYVQFLGVRNDMPDLMSASDLFVLSSAWEGFGLVVAEAMACERLVVATDCGGVGQVASPYGLLVKPKDHMSLNQAINNSLDISQEKSADIGALSRLHIINNYSLHKSVNSYIGLYEH